LIQKGDKYRKITKKLCIRPNIIQNIIINVPTSILKTSILKTSILKTSILKNCQRGVLEQERFRDGLIPEGVMTGVI